MDEDKDYIGLVEEAQLGKRESLDKSDGRVDLLQAKKL
jgi:hypothetical protein